MVDVTEETRSCVGVVLGTKDATPLEFWVGVAEGHQVELDDVVRVDSHTTDGEVLSFYGTVDEVRKRYEGATFDTDAFRHAAGQLPTEISYAAHVQVTRIEPEFFVPPTPGEPVILVRGQDYQQALFFDQMESKLPIGLTRNQEPVYANLEFVDGTRGAHASISGVSGVATKTSFATFLLYSLFHSNILGTRAVNSKAIIFNVKGEDLLWLDKANNRLSEKSRQQYALLGLPVGPFSSVKIVAPPRTAETLVPSSSRLEGVDAFCWTLRDFARDGLLKFCFTQEDERAQLSFVVQIVERYLVECAKEGDKNLPYIYVENRQIRTFEELVDELEANIDGILAKRGGRIASGTVDAFLRRLRAAGARMGQLVRGDDAAKGRSVDTGHAQVTVVDIHGLHATAQMFVVGVVLKRIMEAKERAGSQNLVFVVLDELNKYAPRSGSSPISETILDIAERGRSLGVSLLGAQQTASEVERRVVANAALRVVGRLDPAESGRQEYGFLKGAARIRSTMIRPGTMIVSQPEIPTPLLVQFPFPSWATRQSEVVDTPFDPSDDGIGTFGRPQG
ncbi:MAG: ATP-binding protein [bacterium]